MCEKPLVLAVSAAIACILQIIGLVRYTDRLPEDYIGIALFSVTAVAFAIVSLGFLIINGANLKLHNLQLHIGPTLETSQ